MKILFLKIFKRILFVFLNVNYYLTQIVLLLLFLKNLNENLSKNKNALIFFYYK